MTQPLYESDRLRRFVSAAAGIPVKIFVGLMPVLSSRTAEYLYHEVPEIQNPQSLREKLTKKKMIPPISARSVWPMPAA